MLIKTPHSLVPLCRSRFTGGGGVGYLCNLCSGDSGTSQGEKLLGKELETTTNPADLFMPRYVLGQVDAKVGHVLIPGRTMEGGAPV